MSQWIARLTRVHLIILVLSVATFMSAFTYLKSLDDTIEVAVLKTDKNVGDTITENDIDFVEVRNDEQIASYFFSKDKTKDLNVLARLDLGSNDFLTNNNVVRDNDIPGYQSLSIGVEIDKANGGNIKRNDIVDIWQTGTDAKLVANKLNVRKVIQPDTRLGVATSQKITIVLAVTSQDAASLSKIVNSNDIMVVLANGDKSDSSQVPGNDTSFVPIEIGS